MVTESTRHSTTSNVALATRNFALSCRCRFDIYPGAFVIRIGDMSACLHSAAKRIASSPLYFNPSRWKFPQVLAGGRGWQATTRSCTADGFDGVDGQVRGNHRSPERQVGLHRCLCVWLSIAPALARGCVVSLLSLSFFVLGSPLTKWCRVTTVNTARVGR